MKTIILCGGLGTRLKEETDFKPKPMVYVGNKPLLWHIMKIYSHYEFNEFILALGYKADYIKDYFLNHRAFTSDFTMDIANHKTKYYDRNGREKENFKITFVDTGVDTLVGERILKCEKYIPNTDEHFMVTYGDGVSDVNIKALIKFHKKEKTLGTITGVHPRSKYGLVKVNKKNLVTSFVEKPVLADWVNGGYMVFNKNDYTFFNTYRDYQIATSTDNSIVDAQISDKGRIKIKIKTLELSEYIKRTVDILKIDVEGVETIVIDEIKNKLEKVDYMTLEFHVYKRLQKQNSLANIIKILEDKKFFFLVYEAEAQTLSDYENHFLNIKAFNTHGN